MLVQITGSGARVPWIESQLYHLPTVTTVDDLPSLCLLFLICKTEGDGISTSSEGCYEDEMSIEYKVLGTVAGMWHYSVKASYYYQNVSNVR